MTRLGRGLSLEAALGVHEIDVLVGTMSSVRVGLARDWRLRSSNVRSDVVSGASKLSTTRGVCKDCAALGTGADVEAGAGLDFCSGSSSGSGSGPADLLRTCGRSGTGSGAVHW